MLQIVKGNLLDLAENKEFDIIVHGCNCFNAMGAGIALQIKRRYPSAYLADQRTLSGDIRKLGDYTFGKWTSNTQDHSFVIINAYTQFGMARAGENVFSYIAFELILQKLSCKFPGLRYGFPRIGQGLAGGDPQRIDALLEKFAKLIECTGGSVTLVELN